MLNGVLEGIFPVVCTTFDENGGVDLQSQARLVNYLLEQGAHGLALFGNAGEGYTLTPEEWWTLLKLIQREVKGRVPVVVSTGHTGTDAAALLSKRAEDAGADAVMVLPPYYLRPDGDGILFYYEAISKAIRIPIMVQDAPLMTQVKMSSALLGRICRQIEGVKYVKVESPPTPSKISAILESAGLTVFGGLNGQFMIEEIGRGARGIMPGSDMTSSYVEIWNQLRAGQVVAAWQIFIKILPLIRFELQPGMGVAAMKHNLHSRRIIRSTNVRHPTGSLDVSSIRELEFLRNMAYGA